MPLIYIVDGCDRIFSQFIKINTAQVWHILLQVNTYAYQTFTDRIVDSHDCMWPQVAMFWSDYGPNWSCIIVDNPICPGIHREGSKSHAHHADQ